MRIIILDLHLINNTNPTPHRNSGFRDTMCVRVGVTDIMGYEYSNYGFGFGYGVSFWFGFGYCEGFTMHVRGIIRVRV